MFWKTLESLLRRQALRERRDYCSRIFDFLFYQMKAHALVLTNIPM